MDAFFAGDWALEFQNYLGLLETSELSTDQKYVRILRCLLYTSRCV